ncbi:MAG: hypothetical protein ACE5D8_07355 [Fidelibacterota bacterium]
MNRLRLVMLCWILVTVVPGQMMQRRLFSFSVKGYEVHFSSDLQNKDRQIADASFNGKSSLNTFFESIGVNGTGSIYHPNLMFYSLNTGLGVNQNVYAQAFSEQEKTRSQNVFNDIAFQSIWLGSKPLNFAMGYNQKYSKLNSNFFDNSINRSRRWYTRGSWRTPSFCLNMETGRSRRAEAYGNRSIIHAERTSGLRGAWGTMQSINGSANLNFSRVIREEKGLYRTDVRNMTLQSSNSLPLHNKGKSELYSSLFVNQILSKEDLQTVNITNSANYEWSHTLNSTAGYLFRYSDTNGRVNRSHTANTALNHQLYASLTTLLSLRQDYYIEHDYQQRTTDFTGDWQYTKKLPVGRLNMNYAYLPHWENINSEDPLKRWVEDVLNFDIFDQIILRQENILPATIEVFNAEGTFQYQADLDYSVLVFDNRVELIKTPTTSIPDSQAVLIRYQWQGRKNEVSGSVGKQFGVSYDYQTFWGLNFGMRQSTMEYPKSDWTTLTVEDNRRDRSYFITVDYPPVKLTSEYTSSNSSITPYERLDTGFNTILGSFLTQYIMLNLQYGSEFLPLKDDRQMNTFIMLEAFRRLSRAIKIKVGFSQKEVDGKYNQIFEKRYHAILKYQNRRFDLTVSYENFLSRVFKETEMDQQWKIQLDFRS